MKRFLVALLLFGCHSQHAIVDCPEGAPMQVVLDVTVLDRGTNTIIELPTFTIDGNAQSAGCTDTDAARCPEWRLPLDYGLASGTHTLTVSATNYAPEHVTLTAKGEDPGGACGDYGLASVSPSSLTVAISAP